MLLSVSLLLIEVKFLKITNEVKLLTERIILLSPFYPQITAHGGLGLLQFPISFNLTNFYNEAPKLHSRHPALGFLTHDWTYVKPHARNH